MTGHNRIPTRTGMSDETFESLVCGGVVGTVFAVALILWAIL